MANKEGKKKLQIKGRPQPLPIRSAIRKDTKTKYEGGGKISRKKTS